MFAPTVEKIIYLGPYLDRMVLHLFLYGVIYCRLLTPRPQGGLKVCVSKVWKLGIDMILSWVTSTASALTLWNSLNMRAFISELRGLKFRVGI